MSSRLHLDHGVVDPVAVEQGEIGTRLASRVSRLWTLIDSEPKAWA
jgi:hypothetical protein